MGAPGRENARRGNRRRFTGRFPDAVYRTLTVYVTATILDAIFERDRVEVEILQAAFCVYLFLGLIWFFIYALVELAAPGSFRSQGGPHVAWSDDPTRRAEFLRMFVFSYSTLTSTGFGDLSPTSGFASICGNLESLCAQVYLAVVIARLVGMQAPMEPRAVEPSPTEVSGASRTGSG